MPTDISDYTDELWSFLESLPASTTKEYGRTKYTGEVKTPSKDQAKSLIEWFLNKLPLHIQDGSRHPTMIRYAALLCQCGYLESEIQAKLADFDKKRNNPPKNDSRELEAIAKWSIENIPVGVRVKAKAGEIQHPPQDNPEQPEIEKEAVQVLKGEYKDKSGEPVDVFEYFLREFRRRHTQDELSQTLMLCAVVCPHVNGSFGIFPKASGEKQSGKSSSIYSAACQIHPDFVLFTSFSGKGLYYNAIREGHIIISDDSKPNDDMIELMKKKMSSEYHKESKHLTVDKGMGIERTIPAGVTFILTSVTDSKSDQLLDRQWVLPTDKNTTTDEAYSNFLLDNAEDGFKRQQDTKETLVCWEITRILKTRTFDVAIPFAKRIQFSDEAKKNRRSENNFIDLIRCHAAINFLKREVIDGVIQATIDDYNFALTTMGFGEQRWSMKLSKPEETVWNIIVGDPGISQADIAKKLGVSAGRITQILHGEDMDSQGLADKAPLLSEKEYNKDTGKYPTHWHTTNTVNRLAIFATLKPE